MRERRIVGAGSALRLQPVELVLVLGICLAGTGAYAVYAGQDTNWDQRNYHFYGVHAWLNGRIETDLAPGQRQTWINPLPHLPQYWLIRHLPPLGAGLLMGMLAGINGVLLWILMRRLMAHEETWFAIWCAAVVTLLGMTGSIYVSYVGTTFAEYLCSPLVLGALIALVPLDRFQGTWPARSLSLCGFCLGLATGLKLTNLIFAIGMSATLLVLWPVIRFRFSALLAFVIGALAGFVAFGGFWAVKLWLAFHNPVFPFFNNVFQSPLFDLVNFGDMRFPPKSFLHAAVTYPFAWLLGMHPTSEVPLREARFATVAALLPPAMITSLLRLPTGSRERNFQGPRAREFWLLGLFFVFSFAIWLKQFGVQRYVLPLEMLTGAIVLLSLERLLNNRKQIAVVLSAIAVFAIVWTRPADWTRIPYGDDWFAVAAAPSSSSGNLYLMLSWEPTAYAIPFMGSQDRFVRLGGNMPLEPQMPLGKRAGQVIEAHTGPIRTLTAVPLDDAERARLQRFGLTVLSECRTIRTRLDTLISCDVERIPEGHASQ